MVPRILNTSRANIHHMRPTEWGPYTHTLITAQQTQAFLSGLWQYISVRAWRIIPYLVVAGDGDINISERRVSVAQSDGGDVHIRSLSQRLVVSTRVGHNQEAGLPEGSLNLISECTRGEASSKGGGTSGRGKFEHSPLKECNKKMESNPTCTFLVIGN